MEITRTEKQALMERYVYVRKVHEYIDAVPEQRSIEL